MDNSFRVYPVFDITLAQRFTLAAILSSSGDYDPERISLARYEMPGKIFNMPKIP